MILCSGETQRASTLRRPNGTQNLGVITLEKPSKLEFAAFRGGAKECSCIEFSSPCWSQCYMEVLPTPDVGHMEGASMGMSRAVLLKFSH